MSMESTEHKGGAMSKPSCWHCGETDLRLIQYVTTSPETGVLYQCTICGGLLDGHDA